jgi:hypothetical protein
MFQRLGGRPENLAALDRIEGWTRARFGVPAGQIVLVSEEASGLPGFPARDVVVRFWLSREARYRFRVFKPARDVAEADLPVAWMLPALTDDGDPDCC